MTRIQSSSADMSGSLNYDPEEGNLESSLLETRPELKTSPLEYVYGGLAITSVAVSIPAMVVCPAAAVITAGILGCGLGPYGYYQQKELKVINNLSATREKLQEEKDTLREQVSQLENSVDELGELTTKLFEIEDCFNMITSSQNQSVCALEDQVNENRKVMHSLEALLRTMVLQNLLQVMTACDKNGEGKLQKDELEYLIRRVKDINGVVLNEERFRQEVKDSGGSIDTVMKHIKESLEYNMQDPEFFEIGY